MKPNIIHWLFVILAGQLLSCGACAQGVTSTEAVASHPAGDSLAANYRLLPNDLIFIKVFQEDDLNSTLRIAEDGTIIFPLIGATKIGGLSVADATKLIRDRLDARFLVNPHLTVTVLRYANRNVTVLGQVQKPGAYSLKDQGSIDLLQAVGLAGGFTRLSNPSKITIKRNNGSQESVLTVDGKRLAHDSSVAPFAVLPGDTITVAERMF
jgi:protein involved in polysaccharide export with SLBB domain